MMISGFRKPKIIIPITYGRVGNGLIGVKKWTQSSTIAQLAGKSFICVNVRI